MGLLKRKNNEARECANTDRASIENNRVGNIDMNIVAKSDYNFQGFAFNPITESGSIWFTSTELAKALGYKKTDAISQIYARNADEFSDSMSLTLNMKVNGINNSLRNKSVRVYSLRGAHLVAMFATTAKAKEFRRWVLDILDREVAKTPESSPLHRFQAKVTIHDTLFGGEVEFYGKAEDLNTMATGICRTLGFEPSGFKQIPMDTKRIRKIH